MIDMNVFAKLVPKHMMPDFMGNCKSLAFGSIIGMTKALYDVEIEPGPKNAKMFGYYLNVTKIFGSDQVVNAAQSVIKSEPNSQDRDAALRNFYEAMRADLKKNG